MIYERIRRLAKAKNLKIVDIEKMIGAASGSLCKIDKHNPSQEKVLKIAEILEVSPEYLMTGEEKAVPALSDTQSRLLSVARQLTPENQELLIELAAALLRKSEEK